MWKVKLATGLASGNIIPGTKVENKYSKFGRYAGLATSGLYVITGIVALFLYSIIIGVICIVIAPFIFVLEFPVAPFAFLKACVNFFNDYKFRAPLYIVLAIPAFFGLITILGAIAGLATAGLYGFAAFRGEKGEELKQTENKYAEQKDGQGSKKASLASKGSAPGIV